MSARNPTRRTRIGVLPLNIPSVSSLFSADCKLSALVRTGMTFVIGTATQIS